MDKKTFLKRLQMRLKDLPEEDLRRTLEYYREMIEDRMEEGLTEEEAVACIGAIEEIAEPILPKAPKRKMRTWEILLLVFGFPVWFPLLVSAGTVVISIIVSIYAVDISLAASGVGCVLCAVVYAIQCNGVGAAFVFGTGLLCSGLAILCFMGSNALIRLFFKTVANAFRKGR